MSDDQARDQRGRFTEATTAHNALMTALTRPSKNRGVIEALTRTASPTAE